MPKHKGYAKKGYGSKSKMKKTAAKGSVSALNKNPKKMGYTKQRKK